MKYNIYNIVGEYVITADAGQKVYDLIQPELLAGQAVELDFTGIRFFVTLFFNYAIGQLLRDISPNDLNQLLEFTALNSNGMNILEHVCANAKRYYSDPQFRTAVDSVIDNMAVIR